jgi:putative hydrolase of the HAD superfamily
MLPYRELQTLFLDVGNTLVSMDYDWIARELSALGLRCEGAALARAEAAARPQRSAWLGHGRSTEGGAAFEFHVRAILARLDGAGALPGRSPDALVQPLIRALHPPRGGRSLWSRVMPGVRSALESLCALGLQLVVVSNSNGTVERGLQALGLREFFALVVDSGAVGLEKPDPRIFRLALERSGARAERTLHVGDLYHVDVLGARGAGVHALLLDPFGDWEGVDCACAADLEEVARRIAAART